MKALELADELMADKEHLAVSQSEIAAELRRLAAVEVERDALKAELERIKAPEPVAWIRPSGKAMLEAGGYCTVYASDGMSNHSTALYALGSKT